MKRSDILTTVVRFWSQVDRSGECWLWTGGLNSQGYGRLDLWAGDKHERVFAHRLAYMFFSGEDITNVIVRHDCDTPRCCNPAHLRTGTHADNVRDAMERQRANLDGLAIGHKQQAERLRKRLEIGEKLCPACETVKPLDAFHKARGSVDGRQGWCKTCRSAKLREAYRSDPEFRERELARGRARRAAQPPPTPKPPRTHCGNEHELTPQNVGPRGQCKRCAVDRARRAYERNKQAKAEGGLSPDERAFERRRRMRRAARAREAVGAVPAAAPEVEAEADLVEAARQAEHTALDLFGGAS